MKITSFTYSIFLFILLLNCISYGQADRPLFKSALSKYTFSTTLEKQEQKLKSNPIVQRFAESRKKLSFYPLYKP